MREHELEAISKRLDRLEAENRRWKILGGTSVAVLGLMLLLGATGTKVVDEIQARKIVLVDDAGQVRLRLNVRQNGAPMLRLYDKDRKRRLSLNVGANDEPGLWLYDDAGNARLGLKVRASGMPMMQLYDENGKVVWKASK